MQRLASPLELSVGGEAFAWDAPTALFACWPTSLRLVHMPTRLPSCLLTLLLTRPQPSFVLPASTPPSVQAIDTLVLLMGGRHLAQIVEELQRHGRPEGTPVAVVREAACAGQTVWRGSLGSIVEQTAGEQLSPCIVVVGEVAR